MCEKCQSEDEKVEVSRKSGRRKLWDLERSFACPVIGNCLTMEELRKLGRQCKIDIPEDTTDYYIHRYFVNEAYEQGLVSRKLHKFLDRKYAVAIKRFTKAKTETEVEQLWAESSKRGDLTGPFWALATHPRATEDLMDRVHGELHMLSHIVSRTSRSMVRQVRDQEKLIGELQESHSRERQRLQGRLDAKSEECVQLKSALQLHQQGGQKGGQGEAELQEMVDHLQAQLEATLRIAEKSAERATRLEFELEERKQEIKPLELQVSKQKDSLVYVERELELAESQLLQQVQQDMPNACDGCNGQAMSLCGKCVLYVGGRTGIKQHYRQAVEQSQGSFIHHDGGKEDAYSRLHGEVLKADTVLCPVDCVSHTAALGIKELCKKHGKQLVMLRSSGLSSLLKGLHDVGMATN